MFLGVGAVSYERGTSATPPKAATRAGRFACCTRGEVGRVGRASMGCRERCRAPRTPCLRQAPNTPVRIERGKSPPRDEVGAIAPESPVGPLDFECSQHRRTPRPSVERIRRKACCTGEPRSYKNAQSPRTPPGTLSIGLRKGPRGGADSYERCTPVAVSRTCYPKSFCLSKNAVRGPSRCYRGPSHTRPTTWDVKVVKQTSTQ